MSVLSELGGSRELLVNLTQREVRGKYKRTALGQGWSLLNPIATLLIYTAVFGFLLKAQPRPGEPSGLHVFVLWLAAGLLPWTFMTNAMTGGMHSLLSNSNLIKKVYFPREVLVVSTVLSWDVSFLIEMGVLAVLVLAFGAMVLPWLPLVLVVMALLTVFALGLGLMLSVANVYFRDTTHFVGLGIQFWFYLTPIVYPISLVAGQVDSRWGNAGGPAVLGWHIPVMTLYRLNPMERFVACFRALIWDNTFPYWLDFLYITVVAAMSLTLGLLVFRRFEGRLAEEL